MGSGIQKKRAVISYENMSAELAAAFKEVYPKGYADYMGCIIKIDKPDGSFFYAVPVELPEALYLVKVKLDIDSSDDIEKKIFGDGDDDEEGGEGSEFPDTPEDNMGITEDKEEDM